MTVMVFIVAYTSVLPLMVKGFCQWLLYLELFHFIEVTKLTKCETSLLPY